MWKERLRLFRGLLPHAHPDGDVPSWLSQTLDGLDGALEELRGLRVDLDARVVKAMRQEEEIREIRLRIGHALDELARDQVRVQRELEAAQERVTAATARLDELTAPLAGAWAGLPPVPADGSLSRTDAEALRDLGSLATVWIEAERAAAAVRRDVLDRQGEQEDLRFQVAQLKGRLGGLNAEGDIDLSGVKEETLRINREMQDRIERVVRDAEPVVRHFLAFPALREVVLGRRQLASLEAPPR